MPIQEGISVETVGRELVLTRRWYTCWKDILVLCYGLFGFGLFLFIATHVIDIHMMLSLEGHYWLFLLVAYAGLHFFYIGLASICNTTVMRLNDARLSVRHFPIPWLGNTTIPSRQIKQVYIHHVRFHTRGGDSYRFQVIAMLRSGGEVTLINGLRDPLQAEVYENAIEQHLRIYDMQVAGEYPMKSR